MSKWHRKLAKGQINVRSICNLVLSIPTSVVVVVEVDGNCWLTLLLGSEILVKKIQTKIGLNKKQLQSM